MLETKRHYQQISIHQKVKSKCILVIVVFITFGEFIFHFTEALVASNSLPKIKAAVIVPGFLTGADEFQSLVQNLNERGIPSIAVPFPNWHWIPCLGGRSARPILERIDFTVTHLCANGGDVNAVPDFKYNALDCWNDFLDNPGGILEVGGSAEVDLYPQDINPRGVFDGPSRDDAKGKIALIGHSAGGWISRVYLSNRSYGGRVYNGAELIHSLVTLGSPHGNSKGGGAAFAGVEWINRERIPDTVRALAVAGKGFSGKSSGQFTKNAYAFCCSQGGDGTIYDGDGVTPIESALAVEGKLCEKLILQGTVTHFPWSDIFGGDFFAPDLAKLHREKRIPWYGSYEALDQWVDWLK